ncbi:MAG: PAS domain-containing protein [Verrucomicrobiota bacterium]
MLQLSLDSPRVLLIESDERYVAQIRELAESDASGHFKIVGVALTLADGLTQLKAAEVDVVILDLVLPDVVGVEAFMAVHHAEPGVPVVVLAEERNEMLARQAIQSGAQEYLLKERMDAFLLNRATTLALERSRYRFEFARERAYLRTLLDNIPDRIYFKDEQSRFIRINRALTDLFGLKRPEDAYGRTDADFYGGGHAVEAIDDERRVMQTGEAMINKVEYEELQGGGRSWSLTTKLPLRDRNGKIVGTCGISREITAIKEMEAALERERNLLRAVIDNLPDHIFLKDIEGRYLLDNLAHQKWLGATSAADVVGHTPYDFFPKEIADGFCSADEPIFETGQAQMNYEEKALDPRGGMRWAMVTKVPWKGDDGRVLGLVCIKRNITEQKLAEMQLKQANVDLASSREDVLHAMGQLQSAHTELRGVQMQLIEAEKMKLIGRLAAGIAHEVKNPLAIIKMGIDFMDQVDSLDDTSREILTEMHEAVRRADSVILGLLDFSKPSQIDAKPADLNKLVETALKAVRVEMKGAVEVVQELDPRLPALALDLEKMNQVLVNLLTNAVHAMEGGGTLSVRTYSKQLTGVGRNIAGMESESFRVGQTLAVLEIDDTGHGIPEEKLAKIFEPFFTTKPTGKGTGLGLSVVKTIVDLHGGTIDIRNRPEGGARATLMFQVQSA